MKRKIFSALEHFFWKTLCCRPDGGPLHSWWYHHTGNIARWFHRHKGCPDCEGRAYRSRT